MTANPERLQEKTVENAVSLSFTWSECDDESDFEKFKKAVIDELRGTVFYGGADEDEERE